MKPLILPLLICTLYCSALCGCAIAGAKGSLANATSNTALPLPSSALNSAHPSLKTSNSYPLGSAKNPVKVHGQRGEYEYVSRLICSNGELVSAYIRIASGGPSPYGSLMDIYRVICDTNQGAIDYLIYFDKSHPGNSETQPVANFLGLAN